MAMTLALWSSKRIVPFVSNEEQVHHYFYSDTIHDINNESAYFVDYEPGAHEDMLTKFFTSEYLRFNKCDKAIYFNKHGNKWQKFGTITNATKITNENGKVFFRLFIYKNEKIILSTNKKDSLKLIGYQKKNGKGMGNIMQGVCYIEKN